MTTFAVVLRGGSPWGFRITGGREFNEPITVSKINPNSKAYNEGLKVGDIINEINRQKTHGLNYSDAQQLIKNSTDQLLLEISREAKAPNVHLNGAVPASVPQQPQKLDTEINLSERGYSHRPYEPPQAYSAQSSPGGVGPYAPARSLSLDEGARNVPIIVQTSGTTRPQPFQPPTHRTRSNSENADSFYHVRPAHDHAQPAHSSGFASWQGGQSHHSHGGRNFGVGSYATLPAKSSSSSSHHYHQAPQQQQQQQQPPPVLSSGGGSSVPLTQPLSVDADQPINDFDYHIYSTLPTIKPLRSSNRGGPLDLPDLEREKKFQDFSKPLWTNTDLPGPSQPGGDDSHSPPSDNAVSSSDSRDTIIARSDETRSSHTDSTTLAEVRSTHTDSTLQSESKSQPKMIPVRVVHEDSGRGRDFHTSSASEFEPMDQPWGKRGRVTLTTAEGGNSQV